MKRRQPSRHSAQNRAVSEFDTPGPRFDVLQAGTDPLKRRRFGFAPAPVPVSDQDGPATPLTAAEVQRLVAAGMIRFPQPTGEGA